MDQATFNRYLALALKDPTVSDLIVQELATRLARQGQVALGQALRLSLIRVRAFKRSTGVFR